MACFRFFVSRKGDQLIRLGLCCQFAEQPIACRTTTAKHIASLTPSAGRAKLSQLCLYNAQMLKASLEYCAANGIRAFRVQSQLFPVKTHPECGYDLRDLADTKTIIAILKDCGIFARENDLRLSFHPDQFVVLNSPSEDVVRKSVQELDYQAEVAELIGADTINIHGGGGYGNKSEALKRFEENLGRLPARVRLRLTVENDDKIYSPRDLLALCLKNKIPLVYDVHHHRCLKDDRNIEQATSEALKTWGNREPLFHISSPKDGWNGPDPARHHDYIDIKDFPENWRKLEITVEIEAKAKELAVLKLMKELNLKK